MAANLIWRPQAREDLLVIYEFIGLDNPPSSPPNGQASSRTPSSPS
jgi:hypothetical protein